MVKSPMTARCRFQLVLIKPSHYDDDGYVIRWWRAMIPSNSLAALYAIAADCAKRLVLGPDVAIDIEAIDETNTRIDVPALLARFRSHSNFGLVGLVGVQSNQYPRALDIARPFRDAGIQVAMGGFHVSGCLSMLDGHAVDLDACRDMGIAMFAGEAEGRLDKVLQDAAGGRLALLYDFMKDLPGIEGTPVPFLPKRYVARTLGLSASFDAGRGCPYQCSFCTIINVQGRKSRYRSADDVEHVCTAHANAIGCIRREAQDVACKRDDALSLPGKQHLAIFGDLVLALLGRGEIVRVDIFQSNEHPPTLPGAQVAKHEARRIAWTPEAKWPPRRRARR